MKMNWEEFKNGFKTLAYLGSAVALIGAGSAVVTAVGVGIDVVGGVGVGVGIGVGIVGGVVGGGSALKNAYRLLVPSSDPHSRSFNAGKTAAGLTVVLASSAICLGAYSVAKSLLHDANKDSPDKPVAPIIKTEETPAVTDNPVFKAVDIQLANAFTDADQGIQTIEIINTPHVTTPPAQRFA